MGQLHRPEDRAGRWWSCGPPTRSRSSSSICFPETPPPCSRAAATRRRSTPSSWRSCAPSSASTGPLWEQYLVALGNALTGDFGTSTQTGRPASDLLVESLPPTLALTAFAFVLSVVFGITLALAASLARAQWLRNVLSSLPPLGVSVPVFWIGLLLLQAFSFRLRLFPSMGNEGFESLVLPAITIAIPSGAFIAQLLSRSLRSTLAQPYVEIVRAKGASERRVQLGHAFRNAAIPALTMVGVLIGGLLSGAVVTETVFSRLGIGRLVVTAVNNRDVPVVQAVVVFAALVFVVANLVVDLVYPLIDRRITLARTAFVAA